MMRMILAGGGTGGHLFPAVALAEKLLAEEEGSEVLFVGTERGIEYRVLPELGYPLKTVDIRGFSGQGIMQKLGVILKMVKSISQGNKIIDGFTPDLVVGVGGYASAPLVVAALMKRIPVVLHEQNAIPGLTNRLLGRWAGKVCVSFEQTLDSFSNAELTGNPLRGGIENCAEAEGDRPTLLVFGGSRGARAINEAMGEALGSLDAWKGRLKIVHQTGDEDLETVQSVYREAGWSDAEILPFIRTMADAYRRSSLIICRAGATTVAELTACGRPAVLIPFPHAANDHQRANAEALARKGAALLLEQRDLDGKKLAQIIDELLNKPEDLQSMARTAHSLGHRGAAGHVLDVCRQIVRQEKAA